MSREQEIISVFRNHLDNQLDWLAVLHEYHQNIIDPYVKPVLNLAIEDTQEVIAQVSSRLRQLGLPTGQMDEEINYRRLYQSRTRRDLGDRMRFVWHGLNHHLDWYKTTLEELQDDPTSQALLEDLAKQAQEGVARWKKLMEEMKVSPDE